MRKITRRDLRDLTIIMPMIPKPKQEKYSKIMAVKKKSFLRVLPVLLAMMFLINNSASANDPPKDAPEDTLCSSVGKWHPKMLYVVLPDLSLSFILPYEPDQSGFYNLFFISKETGETLLLDTIEENRRHFKPLSSGNAYDVVALYNNGKYVRYNDFIFENSAEVDLSNQRIQPPDSLSEHWKTMRAFDDTLNGRTSDRDDMFVSNFIIKGYVYSDLGYIWKTDWEPTVQLSGANVKRISCSIDGYFEINIEDDTKQTLKVSAAGHLLNKEINITANCGLFLVMRGFGRARKI